MSFAKSLVSVTPRGVNMLGEIDLFYPLQTKLDEWFPKKKTPPVAVATTPLAKPKVDEETLNDVEDEPEYAPEYASVVDYKPAVDRYYSSVSGGLL